MVNNGVIHDGNVGGGLRGIPLAERSEKSIGRSPAGDDRPSSMSCPGCSPYRTTAIKLEADQDFF